MSFMLVSGLVMTVRLTGVYAKMLVEDGALAEGALAVDTGERLLVGVDPEVLGEVRLLTEPLAALGAAVWPRVRVDPLVLEQC